MNAYLTLICSMQGVFTLESPTGEHGAMNGFEFQFGHGRVSF